MKAKEVLENLSHRWWFYLLIGLVVGIALTAMPSNANVKTTHEELSLCQQQLDTCKQSLSQLFYSLNDYIWAMKDYCDVDQENPLCIAQQGMINNWTAAHPRSSD